MTSESDGIILDRPMWSELSFEEMIQFYQDVAEVVPELGSTASGAVLKTITNG